MVDIPDLQRIVFSPGQRLTAADLAELQRCHRELRWLHNRSLHALGVGLGLDAAGEAGESVVTVGPGYGVDGQGREILLTAPAALPVPAVAGDAGGEATFYLVASYQDDASQAVAERRPGFCAPEGTVRLEERPLLAWRTPEELREGLDLVLAQAWIRNCQLSRPLSLAPRRAARPADQPYIGAGQTPAGRTPWTAFQAGGATLGVAVVVDTAAARFRATPRYVAEIIGERQLQEAPGPLLAVAFPNVAAATPERFTLQVLLPALSRSTHNPAALRDPDVAPGVMRNQLRWQVAWIGIEA